MSGYLDHVREIAAVKKVASRKKGNPQAFSHAVITAIADWQEYGSSGGSEVIKPFLAVVKKLPAEFKTYSGDAYRFIALKPAQFRKLQKEPLKHRAAESWTTSLKTVQELRRYLGPDLGGGLYHAILKVKVKPVDMLLNYDALHKSADFKASVEYQEDQGEFFSSGLDFGGSQGEIVLTRKTFSWKDVVAAYDPDGDKVDLKQSTRK